MLKVKLGKSDLLSKLCKGFNCMRGQVGGCMAWWFGWTVLERRETKSMYFFTYGKLKAHFMKSINLPYWTFDEGNFLE